MKNQVHVSLVPCHLFAIFLSVAPLLGLHAGADSATDAFEYVKDIIGKTDIAIPEVTMLTSQPIKFRDPNSGAVKSASLEAGSTQKLKGVDGTKVLLLYAYSDTMITGYSCGKTLKERPVKQEKTVDKEVEVLVPIESTDLAQRLLRELKFPPSVKLKKQVAVPMLINTKRVGEIPIRDGEPVSVVAYIEGSDKISILYRGSIQGTIDVADTAWDEAMQDLRNRQSAAKEGSPAAKP